MKLFWNDTVVAVQPVINGRPQLRMEVCDGIRKSILPADLFRFGTLKSVPISVFYAWAEQRCFPENRVDAEELLAELGLEKYDPLQIVMKTNARLITDNFWVDFT